MNPHTATIRSSDIQRLLRVSDQSLYRWLAKPYPFHVSKTKTGSAKCYALPEIVARLRERRERGLVGGDLCQIVAHDTAVRSARGFDDLWLGEKITERAASFSCACSERDEAARAQLCGAQVREAALSAGLPDAERLAGICILHPAIVRFTLTGQDDELPVNNAGWTSFAKALWAVNPPNTQELEVL